MNKKISLGAAIAAMVIVAAVAVSATMAIAMRRFDSLVSELSKRQEMYSKFAEIDNAIRQNYYGTIDEEALRNALASGYASGIGDPYAAFLTAEEYSEAQQKLSGKSTGFGFEVVRNSAGQVVISSVMKGSVAYSSGLQKGDVVTALDKNALGDDALSVMEKALRTATSMLLTVHRDDRDVAVELTTAANMSFSLISVESRMIDTTGYIRIKAFTDVTTEQFKTAYADLLTQGAESIVLDLRDNAGGSLQSACKILDYLLPRGLYAYYTDSSGKQEFRADETYQIDIPCVTLVNGRTEGEAELVAAALHQSKSSMLVGTKTAGRAKVQQYFTIASDNSAVKLTVGELKLLDDTSWEGSGLQPDETVTPENTSAAVETLTDASDMQLQTALRRLSNTTNDPTTTTTTTAATADETTTAASDAAETTTTTESAA